MKSLNFGNISNKKLQIKKPTIYNFSPKIDIHRKLNTSFNFRVMSKVMIKKNAEKYRYCCVAEEHIVSKLSKILIPNFNSTNCRFE